MARFHPLTVTDIRKTTRDAVVLTLKPLQGGDFTFTQGQYLTFRRDFDGEELRRSYSICSGTDDGVLQIGIKRVAGGAFSTWANTALAVGDVLEAMPPMGRFHVAETDRAPHILAFAAGSGITPILSILKSTLAEDDRAEVTLVYANRTPSSVMFREELEDLKNRYMCRITVVHVFSADAQEIDLFRGRIDAEKCARLFDTWIDLSRVTTVYICGPEAMMQTVARGLEDHGVARDRIRFELFAASQPGRAARQATEPGREGQGVPGRVTLDGETRAVTIAGDASLLEAALANDVDAPFACRAGVCSTCKAKVLKGKVEMVANHALEDDDVDAGYVLTCQSRPVGSEEVVWDYDRAGH
ncbi:MAG: 1,2-phenylacetyl-CoA epoxidase subunit PaaE [Pseudomonadota bacterium]